MNKTALKNLVQPLLDLVEPDKPNPLLTPELQKKETEYKILAEFESFVKRIREGFEIVKKENHDKKLADKLKTFSLPENLTQEILEEKRILDVLDMDDHDVEKIYAISNKLYEHQKFSESAATLFFLANMVQDNSMIWLSLGLAEFQLQNWEMAIRAFALANLTDPNDLRSAVYSAECYRQLGDKTRANLIIDTLLKNFSSEELASFGHLKKV